MRIYISHRWEFSLVTRLAVLAFCHIMRLQLIDAYRTPRALPITANWFPACVSRELPAMPRQFALSSAYFFTVFLCVNSKRLSNLLAIYRSKRAIASSYYYATLSP